MTEEEKQALRRKLEDARRDAGLPIESLPPARSPKPSPEPEPQPVDPKQWLRVEVERLKSRVLPDVAAKYACAICEDSGFVRVEGRGDPVRRCECWYRKRKDALLRAARIPECFASSGFDDFDTAFEASHPSLQLARMTAERFVDQYPTEKSGLLFVGPIGVGKTHLACAVLAELIRQKGIPCLFFSYAEMLNEIRATYNDNGQPKRYRDEDGNDYDTESALLRHVTRIEVLLLDEVGKEKPSEWTLDKARQIIGARYNGRRTTLITTNYPLIAGNPSRISGEILLEHKIGADTVSRLQQMCRLVGMQGVDFRPRLQALAGRKREQQERKRT